MNKRLYIIKIIISSLFLIFVGGISVCVVNINPKIQFYDSCLPLSLFLIAISVSYTHLIPLQVLPEGIPYPVVADGTDAAIGIVVIIQMRVFT